MDMKLLKNALVVVVGALVLSGFPGSLLAQNVDAAMLLKPPVDSWAELSPGTIPAFAAVTVR